ncbi:MAG: tRNA (adenosine(37)-N6)-dimethylallyltransferase MiaA [Acholeplasmatales bacterium]|jgi:tRNA dimethylallyltransferase|nr:tRNA (adenosine(37)-N6)-dimethylallyltransferase MiaA [Acholeplasmatales bacterium]
MKMIIIAGITASGKTKLALKIAKHYQSEIINADSVCIYRGLNIGSAKPSLQEQTEVKHHLLDVVDFNSSKPYSIFDFQSSARSLINNLNLPIIVGGSALYVRALLYDYQLPQDLPRSEESLDIEELKHKIRDLNPNFAFPNASLRRMQRYYDLLRSGIEYDSPQELAIFQDYDPLIIYLEIPRELQRAIFTTRLEEQLQNGFIEEVQGLPQRLNFIGYQELYDYLAGDIDLMKAKELIIKRSLKLAKKQKTFFVNQFKLNIFDSQDPDLENKVLKLIDNFLISDKVV